MQRSGDEVRTELQEHAQEAMEDVREVIICAADAYQRLLQQMGR